MQPTRRKALLAALAAPSAVASAAGLAAPALAQPRAAAPREFRIGYQKIGLLVVARQRKLVESRLADRDIAVRWVEFTAGPPLLEALNVGSIDFGYSGDAPPIFAQSAGARLVYVAATPPSGEGQGIIVKDGSPVRDVAGLRGKRVGFTRGSSAHNVVVVALEAAGLSYADITPVFLSPADAAAAFARDSIDAWSIWDPFMALAQSRNPTRVLLTAPQVTQSNSFLHANRGFAGAHPRVVADALLALDEASRWARANRGEVAATLAAVTGVELAAQTVAAERTEFGVLPLTDEVIAHQQATADRFHRLGLIPRAIDVRDNVWTAPGA